VAECAFAVSQRNKFTVKEEERRRCLARNEVEVLQRTAIPELLGGSNYDSLAKSYCVTVARYIILFSYVS